MLRKRKLEFRNSNFELPRAEREVMFAEGEHLVRSFKRSTLERGAIGGNSPVFKKISMLLAMILEYCRA